MTAKVLDVSTAKVIAVSTSDLPRTKAIDDLLSRGISPGTSTETKAGSSPSPVTRPAPAISVEQYEFLFVVKSCVRRGDRVLCSGSVTNKADKPRTFIIYEDTTVVDNDGNSYKSEKIGIGQANGGTQTQLMPGLTTNFFVTFPAVEPSAMTVSIVLGYAGDGTPLPAKVLFRNIALGSK